MGIKAVLDTNAVIYLQKGVLADPLPAGKYFISVITEIELLSFPLLTEKQRDWIRRFILDVTVVYINEEIKKTTISLRRSHRLKVPDAIIAATAMTLDATLLSNDQHLAHVPGISCQSLILTSDTK